MFPSPAVLSPALLTLRYGFSFCVVNRLQYTANLISNINCAHARRQQFKNSFMPIAAGLFLGKQIGIFGFVWLAVRLGIAERPAKASWAQIYGVALLCGIGFTMSLFIGLLAFADPALQDATKLGVLAGSGLSAALGYLVLRTTR